MCSSDLKWAAAHLRELAGSAARAHPRTAGPPPELAALLPRLVAVIGLQDLARIAAEVLTRPAEAGVQTVHLHESVPVGEQMRLLALRLRRHGRLPFSRLIADAGRTAVVVARFLALLLLHRQGGVELDQDEPMGEITVTWCGEEGEGAGMMAPDVEE